MPDYARRFWNDLHRQLRREVGATTSQAYFAEIRAGQASFSRYSSTVDLLKYLAEDLGADLGTKDQIFAHLVTWAQKQGPAARYAQTLLWARAVAGPQSCLQPSRLALSRPPG